MSRKNDQVVVQVEEGKKTQRESGDYEVVGGGDRSGGSGGVQDFFENGRDDNSGKEQVAVQLGKELDAVAALAVAEDVDETEEEVEDNLKQVETRQLLDTEHARALGMPLISVTCQSTSSSTDRLSSSLKSKAGQEGAKIIKEVGEDHFNGDFNNYYMYSSSKERRSSVPNAFLTLILVLFNLFWAVGLTYWHFQLNNFNVAVASLVIITLSGCITSVAVFTSSCRCSAKNKSSSKCTSPTASSAQAELWQCSKVAWLLAAVPCLVPVLLAGAYFISSLLDKRAQWSNSNSSSGSSTIVITAAANNTACGGNERRHFAKSNATAEAAATTTTTSSSSSSSSLMATRWLTVSGSFFLLESLTLCFPFSLLHLVVLMEDPNSIPSLIGVFTLFQLFVLSFSITFSRFQYDRLSKPDRFGDGTEKYLRFAYLWSAKIIWLVTFAIIIVTARLVHPGRETTATVGAVAGFVAVHEIPLWICLVPRCGRLAAKLSGLFFLIPQFTSLISLIFWVNADPHIYHTNIGSIMLGLYFWSETVMLCGWLVDGNADKDIDLVPLYPHLFGDLISSCFSPPPEDTLLPDPSDVSN